MIFAILAQPATAMAQDTPKAEETGRLPAEMAEVLTAVQASGDPRALEALVLYLQRAHPEAQAALAEWTARSRLAEAPPPIAAPPPAPPAPPAPVVTAAAQPQSQTQAQSQAQTQAQSKPGTKAETPPRPMKWSGEGEIGAFTSTGSAPGSGFVGRFAVLAESTRWRIATSGRFDYQKASDAVTRNQIRLTLEPNYKFNERGYVFGLGQYESDRFQGFTDRYSLSGGLGYNLWDQDGRKLSLRAGPAMRITHQVEGTVEQTISAVALADLKFRLTPTLNYSQEASAYFDSVRRTFYSLAAIDSQLTGKLKARLSYTLQHETGDAAAGSLTDTTSRLTLVYGF